MFQKREEREKDREGRVGGVTETEKDKDKEIETVRVRRKTMDRRI